MGGSESKVKQLNEAITTVSSEVIAKASATVSSSVIQKQKLTAVGKGSVVRNVQMLQDAKISLSIMQDASVNASMQADMVSEILAEVSKAKTDFPQISNSKSDTEITNIIRNNVSNTMNIDAIMDISQTINQSQEVAAVSGGLVETVKMAQTADLVAEAVNTMSGDIISDIGISNKATGKSTETTTFFGADLVNSIGDAVSNVAKSVGDIFGFSPQMVMLFVVVVIVGYVLANKQLDKTGSLPGAGAVAAAASRTRAPVYRQPASRGPPPRRPGSPRQRWGTMPGQMSQQYPGLQRVGATGAYAGWGEPPEDI